MHIVKIQREATDARQTASKSREPWEDPSFGNVSRRLLGLNSKSEPWGGNTSAEGSSPLAESNAGGGSVKRAGGKDIFEGEGGEKGHLKMLETYSSSGARVDA